jgi:uncharacterized membrane protein YccC
MNGTATPKGEAPPQSSITAGERSLAHTLRALAPCLLFGLRLWASVSVALYVAFWLQLDDPFWAGTSAAIVCQPQLGASLRKGWFRMIGTLIGAVTSVLLTACFPQDRVLFLGSVALWGAVCAFAATLLRNFASYAAALAGFTVAIVAADLLGATGGVNADAGFLLAVNRASEICIGIASAGAVLGLTDFGGARRSLVALVGTMSSDIARGFIATLVSGGARFDDTQNERRELLRQVIALDPVIDQAFGESAELRYYSPVLQRATDGLYVALAAWRSVSVLLSQLPPEQARDIADRALAQAPAVLRDHRDPQAWLADPVLLRRAVGRAAWRLTTMAADTPALRLLADKTAVVFADLARAISALMLLMADPTLRVRRSRGVRRLNIPDWLPAVVNAGRAFVTIASVAVFWIVSAWPGGSQAITFAAIVSLLLAPRAEQAYDVAVLFIAGVGLDLVLAAIMLFVVLPGFGAETFAGLSLVLAVCLVPLGALLAQAKEPWQVGLFTAMAMIFMPLLAPTNVMNYDTLTYYNSALGIVAGCAAATLAFRLIPPLSPAYRAQRLLGLALHDLSRLLGRLLHCNAVPTVEAWDGRGFARLSGLPESATPLQRARLLAVILVGAEIIRLRPGTRHFGLEPPLYAALARLALGDVAGASDGLTVLDQRLAAEQTPAAVRARARILAISGALAQHAAYFEQMAAA